MKWRSEPAPKKAKVYLGIPTHEGKIQNEIVNAILGGGSSIGTMTIEGGSALTTNFNKLWTMALNNRRNGFTHFAMLHSDIAIQTSFWCDKMVEIMERENVDVLSVAMRLKSTDGMTSTAIERPAQNELGFQHGKMTMAQILKRGKTWSAPDLLVNTGLMLVNMQKSWSERVWFEFQDRIASVMENNIKTFYPVSLAEDYGFSRMVKSQGGKLAVTLEIAATHCGGGRFSNQEANVSDGNT